MKTIFLLLLLTPAPLFAQNESYNYEIEANRVRWVNVFTATQKAGDSLQNTVKRHVIRKGIKIYNEQPGIIQGRFEDYFIGKQNVTSGVFGRFEFNASVTISFKSDRYRVEISEMVTYFMSQSGFNSKSKITEEEQVLKRDGTLRNTTGAKRFMSNRNTEFVDIFTLPSVKKNDW